MMLLCTLALASTLNPTSCDTSLRWRRMGEVRVCRPKAPAKAVVFLLAGDDGWTMALQQIADTLVGEGALVAGIDSRALLRRLDATQERCAYPAADFESLSQYLQLRENLAHYQEPLLIGYSSGAALAYAAAEQAPAHIFKGVISLGFYAELKTGKPWCYEHGLLKLNKATKRARLAPDPTGKFLWRVIQGSADTLCDPNKAETFVAQVPEARFVRVPGEAHALSAAYLPPLLTAAHELLDAAPIHPPPTDPSVADLPLVEVPAIGTQYADTLAIILSGDGGWASIDKEVAAELARRGVATVGLSSLKYFWQARTPESTAQDIARVAEHYGSLWHRSKLLLLGYSFGADVMPFVFNRLPETLKHQVALVALLAPTATAEFEFHVSDWLGGDSNTARPTAPELAKMQGTHVLCLQGETEQVLSCNNAPHGKSLSLPGGHHFDGDYVALTRLVLNELAAAEPPSP